MEPNFSLRNLDISTSSIKAAGLVITAAYQEKVLQSYQH